MQANLQTTRRSFLKQLSAAGISAWTLSCVRPGSAFGAAANGKLNLALLGCGNRMRQLLPSILEGGENVVALCEVNLGHITQLNKEAAKHGDAGAAVE